MIPQPRLTLNVLKLNRKKFRLSNNHDNLNYLLQISWTHALRQIVINCYKFHGREDLLPAFSEEDDKSNVLLQQPSAHSSSHQSHGSGQNQGQSQQQQTVGVVRLNSTGSPKGNCSPPQIIDASPTSLATATQVGVAFIL